MDAFDGEDSENIAPLSIRGFGNTTPSGRRSWFETTPTRVPLPKLNSGNEKDLVAADCLELTHFTRPAYLQFNRVRTGSTGKELILLVKNPCDDEQEVEVERLPKRDFTLDVHEFIVPPNDIYILRVLWRPSNEGRIRERIQFYVNKAYRLIVFMLGEALPPKINKAPLKLFGDRTNTPRNAGIISESIEEESRSSSTPKSSTAPVPSKCLFDDISITESIFHEEIAAESTFLSESNRSSSKPRIFKQPQIGHLTVNRATMLRRQAAEKATGKTRRPLAKFNSSLSLNRKRSSSVTKLNSKSKRRCSLDAEEPSETPRRTLRPTNETSSFNLSIVASPISAPNPFASRNTFYDSKWMEKQEWGFTRWLNFIFNPLSEELGSDKNNSLDTTKGSSLKENASSEMFFDWRQLNRFRREACKLFQSSTFSKVARKIEREVEDGRFVMRKDICLRADKGLQRRLLDLINSFSPLWLRIGLETVCGDILCTSGSDALTRFAHSRILWNSELAREYAHPKVLNFYKPGFDDALHKHILKRFIHLIFFLDTAKVKRLIDFDPCLFKKSSKYKTTKALLLAFSRDYLSGEGDLSKHLNYLGFSPSHQQSALEEFNFSVKNLALDLRDGIRLVKLTELLLGVPPSSLVSRVRCPAVSRLQKIHNVDVAISALLKSGVSLLYRGDKIDPRDLVDGHREKTLALLLCIMLQLSVQAHIPIVALKREVEGLERKLVTKFGQDAVPEWPTDLPLEEENTKEREGAALLLHWVRLVCRLHSNEVCPTNLSRSFCDGRALCLVVHHYQPVLIAHSDIHFRTTQTVFSDISSPTLPSAFSPTSCRPRDWDVLVRNERENQRRLQSALSTLGGIPMLLRPGDLPGGGRADDKLVLASLCYICARLLDQNELTRAAIVIQSKWRARKQRKCAREDFLQLKQSVLCLQRWWRSKMLKLTVNRQRLHEDAMRREAAALVIQKSFRRHRSRVQAAKELEKHRLQEQEAAAITIQRVYCGWKTRRWVKEWKSRREAAVIVLQSSYRSWQCRREMEHRRREAATVKIQSWLRGCMVRHEVRKWIVQRNEAVVTLQRFARGMIVRKKTSEMRQIRTSAALTIQKVFRGRKVRRKVMDWKKEREMAAVVIQRAVRTRLHRLLQQKYEAATVKIQRWFREVRSRRQRLEAVATLQKYARGWIARKTMKQRHEAAICIQRHFRRWFTWKLIRRAERWHAAAELIQAVFRGWKVRREVQVQHNAACIIQRAVRKRNQRRDSAATKIQAQIRCFFQQRKYQQFRGAVLRVQLVFMRSLLIRHHAARIIQVAYRRSGLSRWLRRRQRAAIVIQSAWRGKRQRDSLAHDSRVVEVRQRILTQLAEASEDDKLCNRARTAVDSLLRNQMVTEIMKTIVNLDVVTRLSPTLCEYISESGAVPTLYRLFAVCNRSVPHIDIMASVMSVLLNLGRHPPSRSALWTDKCAPILVELMAITQNAQPGSSAQWLFARSACLLGLMCENNLDRRNEVIRDSASVRRLTSMRNSLQRKEQIRRRRTNSPVRSKAAEQRAREVFLMPDWRRRSNCRRTELSSWAAITFFVDTVLRLPPT